MTPNAYTHLEPRLLHQRVLHTHYILSFLAKISFQFNLTIPRRPSSFLFQYLVRYVVARTINKWLCEPLYVA